MAVLILLPFTTSYVCELRFLTLSGIKVKEIRNLTVNMMGMCSEPRRKHENKMGAPVTFINTQI
jgi:hypothetical protein